MPKGSVIHLSGLSEETTREDIKERLGALKGNVAFINFNKGNAEGWVRLKGDEAAAPIFEKMDGGKVIFKIKEISPQRIIHACIVTVSNFIPPS